MIFKLYEKLKKQFTFGKLMTDSKIEPMDMLKLYRKLNTYNNYKELAKEKADIKDNIDFSLFLLYHMNLRLNILYQENICDTDEINDFFANIERKIMELQYANYNKLRDIWLEYKDVMEPILEQDIILDTYRENKDHEVFLEFIRNIFSIEL